MADVRYVAGGATNLAGKTVTTLDGYQVTYDANGYARQTVSPDGQVKYYDALANETRDPVYIADAQAAIQASQIAKATGDSIVNTTAVVGVTGANTVVEINTQAGAGSGQNSQDTSIKGSTSTTVPADAQPAVATAAPVVKTQTDAGTTLQSNNPGFVYDNQGELIPADSAAAAAAASEPQNVQDVPKPVTGDAVAAAQAASGTQEIANFGTTAPPVNLTSDAVIAAQGASGTDTTDFLGTPKPVIGDGVVNAQLASGTNSTAFTTGNNFGTSAGDPQADQAAQNAAAAEALKGQAALQALRRKPVNDDWRFRIKLAPLANYLYKAADPGILKPLAASNGVVFPYTPAISTAYRANYDVTELVHSNYRSYFYKNSAVEPINISAVFTANSTSEADYVLAVIHFFRSVTKMFYGQDTEQPPGTPPPVVYLRGLGKYQFNEHPAVVTSFSYNLPADVDYIRAGTATGDYSGGAVNLSQIKTPTGTNASVFQQGVSRLINSFLNPGATPTKPSQSTTAVSGSPTYVPTKINIQLTLLPLITRQDQAQQFSLGNYASGKDFTDKGFW